MLNTHSYGTSTQFPPLVIVHGLFGSARNWNVIAKRLADRRVVITVDQRNHGNSFWDDDHSYEAMASDLAKVTPDGADMLGHSMGGKAAMVLALTQPEKLRRLIVADIAPVAYSHSQNQHIAAMESVDLSSATSRQDVADQMTETDPELVPFFLQSVDMKEKRWKLNHEALKHNMDLILGFPEISGAFEGDTLFLTGKESDYVTREMRPDIRERFPKARFASIPGAGHWLHAEKPREFEAAVRAFLEMERG